MLFSSTIYNTILLYILFVAILLIAKPDMMYCHKTNRFKPFGFNEGQTLCSFPVVSMASVVIFYMLFLTGEIVNGYLDAN